MPAGRSMNSGVNLGHARLRTVLRLLFECVRWWSSITVRAIDETDRAIEISLLAIARESDGSRALRVPL